MSDPYAPRRSAPRHGQQPPRPQDYRVERPPVPAYQQQLPGYGYQAPVPPPRKRRRVFLWIFLAVQVLFIVWVIAGGATKTGPSTAQIAAGCYHHAWWPLFKSQADCVTHYGGALNTAGDAGKGIGIALVIVFWMVVDVILGVSYGVYRLATRDRYR